MQKQIVEIKQFLISLLLLVIIQSCFLFYKHNSIDILLYVHLQFTTSGNFYYSTNINKSSGQILQQKNKVQRLQLQLCEPNQMEKKKICAWRLKNTMYTLQLVTRVEYKILRYNHALGYYVKIHNISLLYNRKTTVKKITPFIIHVV